MSDNKSENSDAERNEADQIWQAFLEFDYDKEGHISVNDFKAALEHAGEKVSDDWCYRMISMIDPENKGVIRFHQFKNLITEKRQEEGGSSEEDLLDAFVAMGGEPDGDGAINADKLIQTIKHEFEMTIDIEKLIEEIDEDGSGQIEFDEFTALLTSGAVGDDEDGDD